MEYEEGYQGIKESAQNSRKRMPTEVLDSERKKHPKVTNVDLSHRDPKAPVRLHVSNIPYEIKWQDLKDLFKEKIGAEVTFAEIYNGTDGRPSGVGVVEVKNPEFAKKAIESLHRQDIQGRMIIVREESDEDIAKRQFAASGGYNAGLSIQPMERSKPSMMAGFGSGAFSMDSDFGNQMLYELGIDPDNITSQIFVANVDYRATPDDMEEVFRIAGNVLNVEQKLDKDGKPRGMFVIRFDHPIESVQAISLFHRQHFRDRQLTVKMDRGSNAKPQIVPLGLPAGLQSIGKGLGVGGKPLYNIGHIANSLTLTNLCNAIHKRKPHPQQPLPFAERSLSSMMHQRLASMHEERLGMATIPAASLDLDTIVEATVKAVTGRLGGMFGSQNTGGMELEKSHDFTGMTFDGCSSRGQDGGGLYTQFEDDTSYNQFGGYGLQAGESLANAAVISPGGGMECFSIVLRNLPPNYSWQKLKDKCKEIGEVKFAEIKTASNGRSLGIGTVNFKNSADAKQAVAQLHGANVDGRRLDVRLGYI